MKVRTVTRPGGMKDDEFEAYIRLLNHWQIDLADMPRILEKGSPHRWVHSWEEQEEAERFAKELRKRTRDRSWHVYPFDIDPVERGPLGPVEITVGCQSDGCTYGLHPFSQELIEKKFPHARLVPSVFIGSDIQTALARDRQESIWDHVALILTGLTEDQLNELGGYRIYDPVAGEVFREAPTLVERY